MRTHGYQPTHKHRLYRSNKNTVDYISLLCTQDSPSPPTSGRSTHTGGHRWLSKNIPSHTTPHHTLDSNWKKPGIPSQQKWSFAITSAICILFPLLHSSAGSSAAKATLTAWLTSGNTHVCVVDFLNTKRFLLPVVCAGAAPSSPPLWGVGFSPIQSCSVSFRANTPTPRHEWETRCFGRRS